MGTKAATRNVGGRPSSFTAARALRIVEAVARGTPRAEAAGIAGVGRSTVFRWEAAGRKGIEPFASFLAAVQAAEKAAASALFGPLLSPFKRPKF